MCGCGAYVIDRNLLHTFIFHTLTETFEEDTDRKFDVVTKRHLRGTDKRVGVYVHVSTCVYVCVLEFTLYLVLHQTWTNSWTNVWTNVSNVWSNPWTNLWTCAVGNNNK